MVILKNISGGFIFYLSAIFILNNLRVTISLGNKNIHEIERKDGKILGPYDVKEIRGPEFTEENYTVDQTSSTLAKSKHIPTDINTEVTNSPLTENPHIRSKQETLTLTSSNVDQLTNGRIAPTQASNESFQPDQYQNTSIITTSTSELPANVEDDSTISTTANAQTAFPISTKCHTSCKSDLSKMTFISSPSVSFHSLGAAISLQCSIPLPPADYSPSFKLLWLFQSSNPPKSQCSLIPELTISSCEQFELIEHVTDAVIVDRFKESDLSWSNRKDFETPNVKFQQMTITENVIIENLNEENSGSYMCLVELTCCQAEEHIMSNMLTIDLTIYSSNHTWELVILGLILAVLTVGVSCMIYKESKFKKQGRKKAQELNIGNGGSSNGVPLLDGWKELSASPPDDDEDSFDSDQESDVENRDDVGAATV